MFYLLLQLCFSSMKTYELNSCEAVLRNHISQVRKSVADELSYFENILYFNTMCFTCNTENVHKTG